jgi:hypothetical protein
MDQGYAKVMGVSEKSQEERIFELECHVSLLSEFVEQLVGELNTKGVDVSKKLKYPNEEESE